MSALLILALITALVTAAFWQSWRSVQGETAWQQQVQARWLLAGAADWALALLQEDGRLAPGADHLGEPWAQPVQGWPLSRFLGPGQAGGDGASGGAGGGAGGGSADEARLSLRISDAQGKLNLLNLLEGQGLSAPWLAVFGRLFGLLGLPPSELERLSLALVRASAATAETAEAAQQSGPLMPERAEDLIWLGLSPATVAALRPHVSVLPGRLPVNLNTADRLVLLAVLGGPAAPVEASVQGLLERRRSQPLIDLGQAGLELTPERHSVNSSFFEVQLRVQLGTDFGIGQRVLVQRQGAVTRILWRESGGA